MPAEPFAVGRTVSQPGRKPPKDASVDPPPFAVGRTVSQPGQKPPPDAYDQTGRSPVIVTRYINRS